LTINYTYIFEPAVRLHFLSLWLCRVLLEEAIWLIGYWLVHLPAGNCQQLDLFTNTVQFQLIDGDDASSDPVIGKYCTQAPGPFRTTSDTLTVIFHTDPYIQATGFQLHWAVDG